MTLLHWGRTLFIVRVKQNLIREINFVGQKWKPRLYLKSKY